MSKKKNTLKDLDDFLRQQASSLVAPSKLSDAVPEAEPEQKPTLPEIHDSVAITSSSVLADLKILAEKEGASFRKIFYEMIVQSIENQNVSSPEDKMLINTVLYLKSGSDWKNVIRDYWKKH